MPPSFKLISLSGLIHDHLIMGGEYKGGSCFFVHLAHQLQDILSGLRIEVGSWFVGQDELGLLHQGAGNGHPLLLAAAHFRGTAIYVILESDLNENLFDLLPPLERSLISLHEQGEFDILISGEDRDQVEGLENETDVPAAGVGQFVAAPGAGILVVEEKGSRRRLVQAADDVQDGGLARSRRPGDGKEFSLLHGE